MVEVGPGADIATAVALGDSTVFPVTSGPESAGDHCHTRRR